MHVKSIWRWSLPIAGINPHRIENHKLKKTVAASCIELDDNGSKTVDRPSTPGSAAVIHQMFRSLPEYLASLARENPIDDLQFKTNRAGCRRNLNSNSGAALAIPIVLKSQWLDGYIDFVNRHGLADDIQAGRRAVIQEAQATLKHYKSMSPEERIPFTDAFRCVDTGRLESDIAIAQSSGLLHGSL